MQAVNTAEPLPASPVPEHNPVDVDAQVDEHEVHLSFESRHYRVRGLKVGKTKIEIKWHAPDLAAAKKFPGSNSGSMWTAQIKIGRKLLGTDGKLHSRPSNETHIPIDIF